MQIEEKKRISDFEKTLNSEQARIWKTDTKRFYEQEKEIQDKVKLIKIGETIECNEFRLSEKSNYFEKIWCF